MVGITLGISPDLVTAIREPALKLPESEQKPILKRLKKEFVSAYSFNRLLEERANEPRFQLPVEALVELYRFKVKGGKNKTLEMINAIWEDLMYFRVPVVVNGVLEPFYDHHARFLPKDALREFYLAIKYENDILGINVMKIANPMRKTIRTIQEKLTEALKPYQDDPSPIVKDEDPETVKSRKRKKSTSDTKTEKTKKQEKTELVNHSQELSETQRALEIPFLPELPLMPLEDLFSNASEDMSADRSLWSFDSTVE